MSDVGGAFGRMIQSLVTDATPSPTELALAQIGSASGAPAAPSSALDFPHLLPEHYHTASGAFVAASVPATPSALATAFYDASTGTIRPDSHLQLAVDALVTGTPAYWAQRRKFALAIVDLSADKFAPRYAGFNDRGNFYAASVTKVCGLSASYQLLADMNEFLRQNPKVQDMTTLTTEVAREFDRRHLSRARPLLDQLLVMTAGTPATVGLQPELLRRFDAISTENENGSTALVLLRLPFVASTLLSHGLNKGGQGLWLRKAYGEIHYPDPASRERQVGEWTAPENPYATIPVHSVNAVSIAQFFTLAAQGRLVDRVSSRAILDHLTSGACDTHIADLSGLRASGAIASKCGILERGRVASHDAIHFKASASPREFVVVILTTDNAYSIVRDLFADLVDLLP